MAMDRSSRPMHRGRKKVCSFCVDRVEHIDYKDLPRLRKYVSERAKIIPHLPESFQIKAIYSYECRFFFHIVVLI